MFTLGELTRVGYNQGMIILGIDPGVANTGWAILRKKSPTAINGEAELIDYGCLTTQKEKEFASRLGDIFKGIRKLIIKFRPQEMAIEGLFFAKNVKSAIKVSQAQGVIILAGQQSGLPVVEYTPLNVKITIAGYGRAQKKQIEIMVAKILGLEKKIRPNHAADAVAVGLTHCFTNEKLKC